MHRSYRVRVGVQGQQTGRYGEYFKRINLFSALNKFKLLSKMEDE